MEGGHLLKKKKKKYPKQKRPKVGPQEFEKPSVVAPFPKEEEIKVQEGVFLPAGVYTEASLREVLKEHKVSKPQIEVVVGLVKQGKTTKEDIKANTTQATQKKLAIPLGLSPPSRNSKKEFDLDEDAIPPLSEPIKSRRASSFKDPVLEKLRRDAKVKLSRHDSDEVPTPRGKTPSIVRKVLEAVEVAEAPKSSTVPSEAVLSGRKGKLKPTSRPEPAFTPDTSVPLEVSLSSKKRQLKATPAPVSQPLPLSDVVLSGKREKLKRVGTFAAPPLPVSAVPLEVSLSSKKRQLKATPALPSPPLPLSEVVLAGKRGKLKRVEPPAPPPLPNLTVTPEQVADVYRTTQPKSITARVASKPKKFNLEEARKLTLPPEVAKTIEEEANTRRGRPPNVPNKSQNNLVLTAPLKGIQGPSSPLPEGPGILKEPTPPRTLKPRPPPSVRKGPHVEPEVPAPTPTQPLQVPDFLHPIPPVSLPTKPEEFLQTSPKGFFAMSLTQLNEEFERRGWSRAGLGNRKQDRIDILEGRVPPTPLHQPVVTLLRAKKDVDEDIEFLSDEDPYESVPLPPPEQLKRRGAFFLEEQRKIAEAKERQDAWRELQLSRVRGGTSMDDVLLKKEEDSKAKELAQEERNRQKKIRDESIQRHSLELKELHSEVAEELARERPQYLRTNSLKEEPSLYEQNPEDFWHQLRRMKKAYDIRGISKKEKESRKQAIIEVGREAKDGVLDELLKGVQENRPHAMDAVYFYARRKDPKFKEETDQELQTGSVVDESSGHKYESFGAKAYASILGLTPHWLTAPLPRGKRVASHSPRAGDEVHSPFHEKAQRHHTEEDVGRQSQSLDRPSRPPAINRPPPVQHRRPPAPKKKEETVGAKELPVSRFKRPPAPARATPPPRNSFEAVLPLEGEVIERPGVLQGRLSKSIERREPRVLTRPRVKSRPKVEEPNPDERQSAEHQSVGRPEEEADELFLDAQRQHEEKLKANKLKAQEGKAPSRETHFEHPGVGMGLFDVKWGTFKELKDRMKFKGTLHELAQDILAHPDKYSKKAFKKAQFYHNVIGGKIDESSSESSSESEHGEGIVKTKSHPMYMHPAMRSQSHFFRHPNAQANMFAMNGGLLHDDLQEGYNKVVPKALRGDVSDVGLAGAKYIGRKAHPKAQKIYNKAIPKALRPEVNKLGKDSLKYLKRRTGFGLYGEGLSAEGLSAEGLYAQGLFAGQGLYAEGLSAEGLSAEGLSAEGLYAQGLSAEGMKPHPLHKTIIPSGSGLDMKEKMRLLRARRKMKGGMLDAEPPRSRSYMTAPSLTGGDLPPRSRMPVDDEILHHMRRITSR